MKNRTFYFSLDVSVQQCEQLYMGFTHTVTAIAHTGETVQLPIQNLRPFITQLGIKGIFRMIINEKNKIISFQQVS